MRRMLHESKTGNLRLSKEEFARFDINARLKEFTFDDGPKYSLGAGKRKRRSVVIQQRRRKIEQATGKRLKDSS